MTGVVVFIPCSPTLILEAGEELRGGEEAGSRLVLLPPCDGCGGFYPLFSYPILDP